MGLDHYPMSLFAALPRVYDELADSFRQVYDFDIDHRDLPGLLSFGSWIGGDRDGNPFVTPGSTREALQRARNTILTHYITELERAADQLSASSRQVPVSEAVRARLADYNAQMGEESSRQSRISSSELYRRLLNLMAVRLRHSREALTDSQVIPLRRRIRSRSLAVPRKPCSQPRPGSGRTDARSNSARSAHLWISSLDARHSSARSCARASADRDRISAHQPRRSNPGNFGIQPGCSRHFPRSGSS